MNSLGNVHFKSGNYEEAIKYYNQSIDYQKIGNRELELQFLLKASENGILGKGLNSINEKFGSPFHSLLSI